MNDAVLAPLCATEGCTGTLSFHALNAQAVALAERVVERCSYEVTGIVLADKTRRRMAVVDSAFPKSRWFPETALFLKMMTGGPGCDSSVPPHEALGDDALCPPDAQSERIPPTILGRTSHPEDPDLAPLAKLAIELGCFPVENPDGTTTWGLPGHTTDYANAAVAIKALFALTGQGKVDGRQLSFL